MAFEPGDYVNNPANNDLGRSIQYVIKPENQGYENTAYRVERRNPSGQGWSVAKYDDLQVAADVAAVLQAVADREVH